MSDVQLLLTDASLELVFENGLALVVDNPSVELVVSEVTTLNITEQVLEILVDKQPGIPAGGLTGQLLAKRSNTPFDVEWIQQTKITVGKTPPSSPSVGDLWVDTN